MAGRSVTTVLDRDFLEIRSRILELSASLDRLDRATQHTGSSHDRRLAQIRVALEVLNTPTTNRAENIQRVFSNDYDPTWQESFKAAPDANR